MMTVDFDDPQRTILAGIKPERANPTEIEGKQALFAVNLPEKKMAGEVPKACCLILTMKTSCFPTGQ